MKIYLTDQSKHFTRHLQRLKSTPVMPYNRNELQDQQSSIEVNGPKRLEEVDLGFFHNYQIFPNHIMSYLTQWADEHRQMQEGDTIVQQVNLPPIVSFAQRVIFGVRIKEIIDLPAKKGFSYETLAGHAEKGISTFTVEEADGRLSFRIHTCSGPGNLASKLLGPFFSRPYQAFCTRKALGYVKQQLEGQT